MTIGDCQHELFPLRFLCWLLIFARSSFGRIQEVKEQILVVGYLLDFLIENR